MALNDELLQELVAGLRKRASSCRNWPADLPFRSPATIASLNGKATAYEHAADLVEQTAALLEGKEAKATTPAANQ